ncbi:hypothetical protein HOO65_080043 [Ceratocystis lukuohia]|uniref:EVE domain protein n=1 Tax=Ceratocystis lukuohia TaxID=2019550 RepID=A0ABR4MA27_9PEZI
MTAKKSRSKSSSKTGALAVEFPRTGRTALVRKNITTKKQTKAAANDGPLILQRVYDMGARGATGLWLGTSEPRGPYTPGAMEGWSIERFEREKTVAVPYQDLGAIAAMRKGDFVFWFQRSQDGFTGLLEVVQNNDLDLAASTTLPKAEHDTALTKRREARKKWKKSNKESYDRQHTRFLARESDYKPVKDLDRYGDYDCVDTGLSTVENKDGTVTTTVKKMVNQYSPLYLWWKTRKQRAFFPLSYKEADMLLQLCDIKSIHPSLESKGLASCDASELRKRARRVRGGKKADTEKPLTTRIGVV